MKDFQLGLTTLMYCLFPLLILTFSSTLIFDCPGYTNKAPAHYPQRSVPRMRITNNTRPPACETSHPFREVSSGA
jgi:hypothetical protein